MYNITTTIKSGGIETFYWEVSKELIKQGHQVELISGIGKYIKYDNIPLKMFKFTPREKVFDLGNRFKKWGERVSFFRNAYPYLKTQKYDVFLIHKPLDFFTCYFIKKINPNIKTVFISGGEDFYGFDKFFAKYVDFMFAVSNANKKIIENRYKREVKLIHNGVDVNMFKPNEIVRKEFRKKYNLENKKVLISVGRIVGWKGFQLVIETLKDIDAYYVLIGKGEYLEKLKNLAKELNVEKKVLFLGEIDNKLLPNYLNMGDVFVQPSIGHEAFGITLVEAMACGLPVVASKNGGMIDIIKDGENGFFFEINNKKELKESIIKVLKNRNELSENARNYIVNYFTWEKSVDKLLNFIKD